MNGMNGLVNMAPKALPEINGNHGAGKDQEKSLRKACADFESIFGYYLLKSMRAATPSSSLLSFPGKDTYNMLLDQKVSEELSQKGNGLGLQEMLYRQLSRSLLTDAKGHIGKY